MFCLSGEPAFYQLCSGSDCSARQCVKRTMCHDEGRGMCLCTTKYFITFYMIVLQVFIQSFYRPVGFIVPGLRWLLLWLTVPGDNMLLFFYGYVGG